MTDRCRSCGAPILWAQTEKGRLMPVDAEKVTGGNVSLFSPGPGNMPLAKVHEGPVSIPAHKSHFATCPQASKHRRAKR